MKIRRFSLDDSPGFLISQLANRFQVRVNRALAPEGITGAQWTVLWVLATGRATTPADISSYLSMDTGAITRLLDRMVAKKLLLRHPNTKDRRSVILELTPEAQMLYPTLPPKVAEVVGHFVGDVSAEDLTIFKQVLVHMLEVADSGPEDTLSFPDSP